METKTTTTERTKLEQIYATFRHIATTQFVEELHTTDKDERMIKDLICYFWNLDGGRLNKNKGLFVQGRKGQGKTMYFKILRNCMVFDMKFKYITCKDVESHFSQDGDSALARYKKNVWLFDDLGDEEKASSYGRKIESMEHILFARYDEFQSFGLKTYVTSNLNMGEIEHRYGGRIADRFQEMFNLVSFNFSPQSRRINSKPIAKENRESISQKPTLSEYIKRFKNWYQNYGSNIKYDFNDSVAKMHLGFQLLKNQYFQLDTKQEIEVFESSKQQIIKNLQYIRVSGQISVDTQKKIEEIKAIKKDSKKKPRTLRNMCFEKAFDIWLDEVRKNKESDPVSIVEGLMLEIKI